MKTAWVRVENLDFNILVTLLEIWNPISVRNLLRKDSLELQHRTAQSFHCINDMKIASSFFRFHLRVQLCLACSFKQACTKRVKINARNT